jgi:ABC-type proline/glycine betaine transport system substrate-binding protein
MTDDLLSGPKPDLLCCPFCGASPHWMLSKVKHDQLHGDPYQYRIIACPKGHAQVRMLSNEAAAKEWNTRKGGDT